MSNRWPGGLIRKTPVTPAGPLQNGAAPGMWTLAEASFWTKQGLWPTQGNVLAVEDVFSTWLYTGNSSTQTITNGIDLAGKGGLVWTKGRSNADVHILTDTVRGAGKLLQTQSTAAEITNNTALSGFTTSGFSIGTETNINRNGSTYASWTFREAPNFFDVVTYTGDGTDNRQIAHSLGVAPGFIVVKSTSSSDGWACWHRGNGTTNYNLRLNSTGEGYTPTNIGGFPVAASSTTFTVRNGVNGWGGVNYSANDTGQTYVAYLYAHVTGSDGIIQCGSFTANSGNDVTTTLGWEPQWFLVKAASEASSWFISDTMRGFVSGEVAGASDDAALLPASSSAEIITSVGSPTATGFKTGFSGFGTYIYVAIRRGPMRTPTLGTSVFNATFGTGGGTPWFKAGFPVDFGLFPNRSSGNQSWNGSRLTGETYMAMVSTAAEGGDPSQKWDYMNGYRSDTTASTAYIGYSFRRAPGFMDVVCYTGTGVVRTVNHNLGVAPELMIVKRRNSTGNWPVWQSSFVFPNAVYLNSNDAFISATGWFPASPSSATSFSVVTNADVNASGGTYVAYLFASVPGVSKVGSYTGNGSSQTINCAFTTGARFVLIKRTDSTGDWYVWDSARGIVAGNDPYLALNSTAAEVTTNDSVDTDNTGFVVNQVAASNINVNAATYIFLAIA